MRDEHKKIVQYCTEIYIQLQRINKLVVKLEEQE
jgi:hypothetical protein